MAVPASPATRSPEERTEGSAIRTGRSRRRDILRFAASTALVVALFVFVLPQVADVSEAWEHVRAMTGLEVATLAVAGAWNIVTYWLVAMACLPGLTLPQAAVATQAPTAVANALPAGSYLSLALTYTILHSWGFRRSIVTLTMLISGVWNNFAKLAIPVLALALLAITGDTDLVRVIAGLLGIAGLAAAIATFAAALRTETAAARVGNVACAFAGLGARAIRRRPPRGWDIAVRRFRSKTITLLSHRWHWITSATVVSHISLFAVLLVALRHVGVSDEDVPWTEVFAAFAFARLVTAVPLTPGGLGVVEVAMTTALVAAGGDEARVLAAVLVYRAVTYLAQIPIGAGLYLVWRLKADWRREPQPSSAGAPPDA